MKIRESCLQTGNFIYKPGISLTKQDFHLQRGILGLQRGFSGYYLPYHIVNSRCYSEYGLKRTGCAGCPYSKNFEEELEAMQQHEPQLYKAVNNIFSDSYKYTRKYLNFVKTMKKKKAKGE